MNELLDDAYLISRNWLFYHQGHAGAAEFLKFLPDGRIGLHNHDNERFWRLDHGTLLVLDRNYLVTTRFDTVVRDAGGVTLSGAHIPSPNIILCLSEDLAQWPKRPGTKASLAHLVDSLGWSIGDHTYGVPGLIEEGRGHLTIGKYTSIANDVRICFADHRTDLVSSYPFVSLNEYWPSAPAHVSDHVSKGAVVIGNDVWIGAGVFIGSGVTIGDGAVIAARCVVTRDVPPYALVGGNPGRVIRHRFNEPTIAQLLEIAWWTWPEAVVDAYLPLIMSPDIDDFIRSARADRARIAGLLNR